MKVKTVTVDGDNYKVYKNTADSVYVEVNGVKIEVTKQGELLIDRESQGNVKCLM